MSTQMSSPMVEQLAGKGAARAVRRKLHGVDKRPGWATYAALAAVVLISIYPIYFTILLASSTAAEIARNPIPSFIPGGNLMANIGRVITSDIKFWTALGNSVIVSTITAISVVFFDALIEKGIL